MLRFGTKNTQKLVTTGYQDQNFLMHYRRKSANGSINAPQIDDPRTEQTGKSQIQSDIVPKKHKGKRKRKKGTKARLCFPERPFLMMNKIFNGVRRRETPLDAPSLSLFARPSVSVGGGASE